jgi:hypothetical protein
MKSSQNNPIIMINQSNPIQSNPIQSNPTQPKRIETLLVGRVIIHKHGHTSPCIPATSSVMRRALAIESCGTQMAKPFSSARWYNRGYRALRVKKNAFSSRSSGSELMISRRQHASSRIERCVRAIGCGPKCNSNSTNRTTNQSAMKTTVGDADYQLS